MKTSKFFKKLLSVTLAFAMIFIAVADKTTVQATAESTPEELGAIYLNSTNKYIHLGREDVNEFQFRIKASMFDEGATYTWYIVEDQLNPNSVTIDPSTGLVKAQEAGRAYIRCDIKLADGSVLSPQARVTVRNNISEVDISNMPENNTIYVNQLYDFNRNILNTEAGKDKAASGITRWELDEDNAGVNEVGDKGVLTPTKMGSFKLRAVSFQSKERYDNWLSDKIKYAENVTASSDWYEVIVVAALTDEELAVEAIRGLFVDADAPNDEKALAEGVSQVQIDEATAIVEKLTDENNRIFGHAAIAMAQGLYDEKLAEEEAVNAENALKALEDLFVDISAPNDEKELAVGVNQSNLDAATGLVNKLNDENSKVFGHAVIALAQDLLDEKLANEEVVKAENAIKALEDLFVDISAPNDEKELAEGVSYNQLQEAAVLVNKLRDENSRILGNAIIVLAQGLLEDRLVEEALMIDDAIKALEDLFVAHGSQKKLAEGIDQNAIDEASELVNKALAKAQEYLDNN